MIRSFFITFGVILISFCGKSNIQALNIDSLEAVIAELPASGEKVRSMIQLSSQLQNVDPAEALVVALEALEIAKPLDSANIEGHCHLTIGTAYFYQADYPNALASYAKAFDFLEEYGEVEDLARIFINQGSVYLNMGNLDLAEESFLKGKEYTGDNPKFAQVLNANLALVMTQKGKYSEALELHSENLSKYGEYSPRLRSTTNVNIGYLYEIQGDFDLALQHYRTAFEDGKIAESNYEKGYALANMIGVMAELGLFQEAHLYLDTLLPIAHILNSSRLLTETYRIKATLAEKEGDFKGALSHYKDYVELKDSISIAQLNEETARLQNSVEVAGHEAEVRIMQKEHEIELALRGKQNLIIWILCIGLTLVAIVAGILIWSVFSRSKALKKVQESSRIIQSQYDQLKMQKERLEDLNREKDGLIGIVAHDLKSPLSKTMALVELVMSQGGINDQQKHALEMVLKTNSGANDLIRDLLDLNSMELGKSSESEQDIDLGDFFEEFKGTFSGEAERKKLNLFWPANAGGTFIHTYPSMLSRVLENLISNAIKFTPIGKQVHVLLETSNSGGIAIQIRDEGPGITEEDRQKLFKRFQRLSAQPTAGESSTGLGLAIAKTLVEKMGGNIKLTSPPGRGAEFTVYLPPKLKSE